jgi:glycosyltransferase involved in cell wall biosynthesis
MKKVCFFNSIKFWGGGEKLHLEYALEFKKKNYDVVLLSHPRAAITHKAKMLKLKTHPVVVGSLSFLSPIKLIKLILFFRTQKIDTLIFSTSQDMKLGGFAAKMAGVKQIVYLRGLAVPIKDNLVNRTLFKHVLTHIVANSEETKRMLLKNLGKHIPSEKVRTIYHGIDLSHANKKAKQPAEIAEKGHGVILGNAGRLTEQKGQENLIRMARTLKDQQVDFTLFIAGAGERKGALKRLIKELDLKNDVILLGFVKDIDSFMQAIDIFLLSSKWEGFGYVLVEAMIQSKPIVAFDITSNPEIVDSGQTGFLVKNADLMDFAEKTKLLINDKELRHKMGAKGKSLVEKKFNLQDRITEFEHYLLGKN